MYYYYISYGIKVTNNLVKTYSLHPEVLHERMTINIPCERSSSFKHTFTRLDSPPQRALYKIQCGLPPKYFNYFLHTMPKYDFLPRVRNLTCTAAVFTGMENKNTYTISRHKIGFHLSQ